MQRIRRGVGVCAIVLACGLRLQAHEVSVEQIVDVTIRPIGNRIEVGLRVPATLLLAAKLPQSADGDLDAAAMAGRLDIVAADVARNLDLRRDDVVLRLLTERARVGADRRSVEIELVYDGLAGEETQLSARLNAFDGPPLQPPRTIVDYILPSGPPQRVSVAGPATRVQFDPGAVDTVQQFAARALNVVLTFGDHVLFLACVLLPVRRARDTAHLFFAMMTGQVCAAAIVAIAPSAASALPAALMIAASTIVVVAIQNIVQARTVLTTAVTIAFGILSGGSVGQSFVLARGFAGAHQTVAFVTFVLVFVAAQLWLGWLMWGTRRWLHRAGAPERITTVVASVVVAHLALHRVFARADGVAQMVSISPGHALAGVSLSWAVLMMLIAAGEAIRQRRLARPIPESGSDTPAR
jgi:hypothetical protein